MSNTFRVEEELPQARTVVRSNPVDWEAAKQALIDNEGRWVLIAEDVHASTGEQLRKGKYVQFPEEEIEHYDFRARKPKGVEYGERRTDIWGLYTADISVSGN